MRKLLFVLPTMLFITACGDVTKESIDKITLQVIETTQKSCYFVPTAFTVADIFNNTEIKTATEIAKAICDVVLKIGAGSDTKPKVQSVVVNGAFIRK